MKLFNAKWGHFFIILETLEFLADRWKDVNIFSRLKMTAENENNIIAIFRTPCYSSTLGLKLNYKKFMIYWLQWDTIFNDMSPRRIFQIVFLVAIIFKYYAKLILFSNIFSNKHVFYAILFLHSKCVVLTALF